MMIRAAIRYSEYKSAGKLPHNIEFDCNDCELNDLKEKRNCGGQYEDSKYKYVIGTMEFYQCPLSIPDEETWTIIELVTASEEMHIPVSGHCLLDQTRAFFTYRRIINNEKYQCHKEIHPVKENKGKERELGKRESNMRSRKPPINKKK